MTETGCLNTACATKILMPNGGVKHPILRFAVMTMPKWMRSMPAALTTGRRIGVSSRIAGAGSKKMPTSSRNTLTMKSSIALDRSSAAKTSARRGAAPLVVRSQEDTPADAAITMNKHRHQNCVDTSGAAGLVRRQHPGIDAAQDDDRHAERPRRVERFAPQAPPPER